MTSAERGFSLIELLLTIVIIGIALSVMISAWRTPLRHSAEPLWQLQSRHLGERYLNQVLQSRYDEHCQKPTQACTALEDFGPEQEQPGQFDDIDDYHGVTEQADAGELGGRAQGSFAISISVSYAGEAFDLPSQSLKRVLVSVTPPQGQTRQFVGYRGLW